MRYNTKKLQHIILYQSRYEQSLRNNYYCRQIHFCKRMIIYNKNEGRLFLESSSTNCFHLIDRSSVNLMRFLFFLFIVQTK